MRQHAYNAFSPCQSKVIMLEKWNRFLICFLKIGYQPLCSENSWCRNCFRGELKMKKSWTVGRRNWPECIDIVSLVAFGLGKENARSFYLSSGFLLGNKNVKAQKGEDEFGSSGVFGWKVGATYLRYGNAWCGRFCVIAPTQKWLPQPEHNEPKVVARLWCQNSMLTLCSVHPIWTLYILLYSIYFQCHLAMCFFVQMHTDECVKAGNWKLLASTTAHKNIGLSLVYNWVLERSEWTELRLYTIKLNKLTSLAMIGRHKVNSTICL